MVRLTLDARNSLFLWQKGYRLKVIHEKLQEDGIVVTKTCLFRLIRKFKATGSVRDNRTWKPPCILYEVYLRFINNAMASDDELMSRKLYDMLIEEFPDLHLSLKTVKRARDLGWVCKRMQYCALIAENNRQKRLDWCKKCGDDREGFHIVVWSDECSSVGE